MKDSTKARIAIIEAKLEELDRLSANASEDKLSSVFNDIQKKAENGDSESLHIIDAMTAFHKALKRGESMEEILQRSTAQPDLQQIITNYVHAMQHIVLTSKSL
jgi:hypothetical protein